MDYVFDELSSKIEFMKARALLIYSKYKMDPFSNEHVHEAGKKVMNCMTDQNSFPVKTIASVALKNFIGFEATSDMYRETLQDLLKSILDVLDQFFADGLIDTLKELIGEYDEDIIPYAVDLCQKLGDTYVDMMKSIDFANEESVDPK